MMGILKARPRLTTDAARRAAYALASRHHPRFKKTYKIAIDQLRDARTVELLARAVRNKSILSVDAILPPFDPRNPEASARWHEVSQQFDERYKALLAASGKEEFARIGIKSAFNLRNPWSLTWIEEHTGALIKDISSQTRQSLVALVTSAFAGELDPQRLKVLIRGQIGLLPKEAQAVERRYQMSLEQGVKPQVAKLATERYAARLLDDRAERIARTETIAAEAEGQLDAWRSARDDGLIVEGAKRRWIASPYDNAIPSGSTRAGVSCKLCDDVASGGDVDLDEEFTTGIGRRMAPPLHPGCTCTVVLIPPTKA